MITVITVFSKKMGITETCKYDNQALSALCLKLCGGGYSERQTANAMVMRSKIEAEGVYKKANITVVMDSQPFARW